MTGAERPQLFSTFTKTFDFKNFFKVFRKIKSFHYNSLGMTNLPHAHNLNYNTEYFGAVTGAERPQLFSTFSKTFDFKNFFKSILIFKKKFIPHDLRNLRRDPSSVNLL